MPLSAPASTYADQLTSLGFGLPLWHPEPGRNEQVEIGDVGFLHDGQFIRLFNVTRPTHDPLNAKGTPKHFDVLSIREENNVQTHDGTVASGPLHTASVTPGGPTDPSSTSGFAP